MTSTNTRKKGPDAPGRVPRLLVLHNGDLSPAASADNFPPGIWKTWILEAAALARQLLVQILGLNFGLGERVAMVGGVSFQRERGVRARAGAGRGLL